MHPTAPDDANSTLRQQLELVGSSYADWDAEVRRIVMAADRVETSGGFVDAQNLVRAGEIAEAIDAELAGLRDISVHLTGEVAGQVAGVNDRLIALRELVRDAARRLHGRT
jgi:hypothetical protein